MAVLIGMSADVKGQTHEIGAAGLTIGRADDNALPIHNASVSSHHCSIQLHGESWSLRDLGSTNGTRVNAQEVTEVTLKPKDLVQIGSVEFLFNTEEMPFSEAEAIYNKTEVVEAAGPAVKPQSFNSISPFGARRRSGQGVWATVIIALGAVTLLAVAFLLFKLFTA